MDSFKFLFITLLVLVLLVPSQAQGGVVINDDCEYVGTCKTRANCVGPCRNHGGVGLCVPDPHPGGKLVCCCFVGKQ
ncbi:hypothetical protein P3S67_009224 [Capsicum chacoense]